MNKRLLEYFQNISKDQRLSVDQLLEITIETLMCFKKWLEENEDKEMAEMVQSVVCWLPHDEEEAIFVDERGDER